MGGASRSHEPGHVLLQLCDKGGGIPALCGPALLQMHGYALYRGAWRSLLCSSGTSAQAVFSPAPTRKPPLSSTHQLNLHHAPAGFPDPASSPKSQLPYLQRGRQRIGDSHFIIQHLVRSGGPVAGEGWEGGGCGWQLVFVLAPFVVRHSAVLLKRLRQRFLIPPLAAAARVRHPQRCCTPPTQQQPRRPWQSPACATQIWPLPSFTSDGWMMR